MQAFNKCCLLLIVLFLTIWFQEVNCCIGFYCLNSCGSSKDLSTTAKNRDGFKLVIAVNRDEQVDRPTLDAGVWPPKYRVLKESHFDYDYETRDKIECDQSRMQAPYNLCVYGPLDVAGRLPPDYYSTWLGNNF